MLIKKAIQKLLKNESSNRFVLMTQGKKFEIETPMFHPLKKYLNKYNLIDRFLPFLVKNSGGGLIDIGANIGDTAILVKSQVDCPIICVEPEPEFMQILKKNIERNNIERVEYYPYPISYLSQNVSIVKNNLGSTASISENGNHNIIKTKSFANLASELQINFNYYPTIKIDTDGNDSNILLSIIDYLKNDLENKQIKYIFFEFQFYDNHLGLSDPKSFENISKYVAAVENLMELGFNKLFFFDNFGTFLFESENIIDLSKIANYIISSQTKNSAPTIWFCDILLCREGDSGAVFSSIQEYINHDIIVSNKQ